MSEFPPKPKGSPLVRGVVLASTVAACSSGTHAVPPQVVDPPPQPVEGEVEVEAEPDLMIDASLPVAEPAPVEAIPPQVAPPQDIREQPEDPPQVAPRE
jgi:hypothetical protein